MASCRPFPAKSAPIAIPRFVRDRFCSICRRPLCGPIGSMRKGPMPAGVRELSLAAPRDRLIVALDTSDVGEASWLVERIGDAAVFYKIGMELAYSGGVAPGSGLPPGGQKRVFCL